MGMTPTRHQRDQHEAYLRRLEAMGFPQKGLPKPYKPPPDTLAMMRNNGVRGVVASCACGHFDIVDMTGRPGRLIVKALKMRCTRCGQLAKDVRPDWGAIR